LFILKSIGFLNSDVVDTIDPEEAGPPGAPEFSKKKDIFFSADNTITRALTRAQVRRPQSARVKICQPASASRKK
jgi:hypothetical protein